MLSKSEFAKTLSQTPPASCQCNLAVGDEVIVRNGYGLLLKGFKVIGFDTEPDKYGNFIYLDWGCYWVSEKRISVWRMDEVDFTAIAYSVPMKPPYSRQYNLLDWDGLDSPLFEQEKIFFEHSTEIFHWSMDDGLGILNVHNILSGIYHQKEILSSDEPDYYDPIAFFGKNASVVLNTADLDKLEEENEPLLKKFIEIARNEIAKGNTVYYRAF